VTQSNVCIFDSDLCNEPAMTRNWYWPTLGWGTSHCVVCRQMYCLSC